MILIALQMQQEKSKMNFLVTNKPARQPIGRHGLLAVALSIAGICPAAQATDADGWQWVVAPYIWAVGFNTDLERSVPPTGGISNDRKFDSVLDKFDGAAQVHIEGQTNHWGMLADFTYLGLSDEQNYPRFHTESDLDARLFDAAAVWSPGEDRYNGWDVFAGLRYIDVNLTVDFDPVNPSFNNSSYKRNATFNDFLVGGRYTWTLSDRWAVTLRGDTSFGDTDGTYNASATASYKTAIGAWLFGYRYMDAKMTESDNDINIVMYGPMIGYGFTF
ncbi:MAG: hypothetical protein ACJ8GK_13775 [Luteimonas sp.]